METVIARTLPKVGQSKWATACVVGGHFVVLSRRVQVNRFAIVIQTPSSGQQNPAGTPAHCPVPMHPLEEALDKWCKRATLLRCVALACTEYRTRGKLRYFRAPAFFLCQGSPFTTELAIVCRLQTASLKTKSILLPEKFFFNLSEWLYWGATWILVQY